MDKNEIWKDIKDYEGIYQVSNLGRVKSIERKEINKLGIERMLKEKILKCLKVLGYFHISLSKDSIVKQFKIHRLVAQVFIPNPENKPQVNHKNGIRHDNRVENLEWVTASENMKHAVKYNLLKPHDKMKGSKNGRAKLTENEVYVIKGLLKYTSLKQRQIAEIFNIQKCTVSDIKRNKIWKHIKLRF